MKLKNIILTFGLGTLCLSAPAAEFENIVNTIVGHSPTLKADRLRLQGELENLKGENIPADPEIEFERLWRSGEGENRWSAGISQELEWPGTYRARRKAISALSRAQAAQEAAAETEARLKASQLVIEIITAHKEIAILDEINASMQQLKTKLLTAWTNGEATILDVNKVKIEAIKSASRLETAHTQLRALEGELKAMTGGNEDIAVPSEIDLPLYPLKNEAEYMAAMESSPTMKAMQLTADAAESQTALTKSTRFPGFSIGYNHAYEDGAHFNGFSIGMTLPVWSRKHSMQSAADNALAARFDAIARHSEVTTKLHTDYANAKSIYAQMNEYGPLVEGVNNLTLLRKAFEGGELNLLDYLQEVNYFLEARLDYLTLSKEYALTTTALTIWLQH